VKQKNATWPTSRASSHASGGFRRWNHVSSSRWNLRGAAAL
jgi:hypothetical protein